MSKLDSNQAKIKKLSLSCLLFLKSRIQQGAETTSEFSCAVVAGKTSCAVQQNFDSVERQQVSLLDSFSMSIFFKIAGFVFVYWS